MATIPVYSPTIPFLGLVPGGLRPGSMINIRGVINNHGERCQINIQTGAALNPRDDVALHISIRPNEYAIVRNTLQRQVWGTEERHGGCPIHYGQQFTLLVAIEVNFFKIVINGNHFCTFNHRMSVHLARFISISGGCVINSITTEVEIGGPAAPPYPGTIPGINPPPYTPPMAPYQPPPPPPGGNIGFVPVPPPMPPPPPYTPSPGYPVGGHGPHYKGFQQYPGHRGTAPFSSHETTAPSAPPTANFGHESSDKPKSMMNSLSSGIEQTKNFLHDAVFGKPTTAPPYPQHGHGTTQTAHHSIKNVHSQQEKKSKKYLKYAAGAAAIGLGGYALGKTLKKRRSSSSSSSD
ncbi:galectin-4-like [Wyeomyia smithii]|uniref:galectin-4-like n=1 Tax=Wyeomyia smithii TaxID=174621 RepID=UPI0024681D8B|nr:galectin-4-like [Wyeomyia smithii]